MSTYSSNVWISCHPCTQPQPQAKPHQNTTTSARLCIKARKYKQSVNKSCGEDEFTDESMFCHTIRQLNICHCWRHDGNYLTVPDGFIDLKKTLKLHLLGKCFVDLRNCLFVPLQIYLYLIFKNYIFISI